MNEFNDIVAGVKPLIDNVSVENSKIHYLKHEIDEYGTKTVTLVGGLNGNGEWTDYFNGLSKAFENLKNNGYDAWLLNIDNDVIDDVFYATVGIERNV